MKNRKRTNRVLALLLSLCVLLTMAPAAVFAADGTVAYIDDAGYDSLGSAVRAASSGATITLKEDDTTAQTITISKNLTIELDGHDLTNTSFNITGGNVVIRDRQGIATISCEEDQAIQADFNYSAYGTIVSTGGSLTLEGVNVNGYEGSNYRLPKAVVIEGSSVTINSGSFKGGDANYSGGDAVYFHEGNLTINGGTFTGGDGGGCGLSSSNEPGDSLSIRNGTFIGGGSNSAAFWLGGNINTQGSLEEYFLSEENYIVGTFNRTNVTIGSNLFLSSVYTEPENGSGDVNAPAIIELPADDSVTLEPHVLGGEGGNLTYEWYKDNEKIDNASGSTYTVNGEGDYTGHYHAVISESGTEHTITVYWQVVEGYETYNVWVGGVQVTEKNASDVLGDEDGDGATVTYDVSTNTLTLNGANITSTYDEVPTMGYAAIVSYDELNIDLAEGSTNKITLNGDKFFIGVIAMSEDGTDKNIAVSGSGSLDINITTSSGVAFGIMGSAVTIDGAEVGVTANMTSIGDMVSYIGIMGYSSVAIEKGSAVTATVSNGAAGNIAVMSAGALTIDNANVTAGGYAGIMGMGDISITGESTVKVTGSAYAIAAAATADITLDETLIAQGRADTAAGELSEVEVDSVIDGNTSNTFKTFVLSSNTSTVALYVEIVSASSLHRHVVCGEASCAHDGHEPVIYTALDDGAGNLADGITTPGGYYSNVLKAGNYYLTDDITNINLSIEITGTVNLCLNGHTISSSAAYGIFRIGAGGVLNICDCQQGGKITETGEDEHNPIFLHSGGVLNLYSGTIESRITAVVIDEDPSDNTDYTGGTVNAYGGTVSSSGSGYQAIKVNADMTNAAVNISGGSVTSPSRGISAESGTITISGGTINGNIDTDGTITLSNGTITGNVEAYSDMTMTGGEITGNVNIRSNMTMSGGTINGVLGTFGRGDPDAARRSVKILGDAKIESTSNYAIRITQESSYIDLEINGGTITANNGYGVYIEVGNSTSRIYLSGSPDISGGTADIRSSTSLTPANVNLVLHAKDDEASVYAGGALSITPSSLSDRVYVAQGVTSADMVDKLSLVHENAADYYLDYDGDNKAARIYVYTYEVTLPSGQSGYTVTPETGSSSPVDKYESFSFTVTVDSANKYYKTGSFAVKANNTTLTPDGDGVYTISNITEDQTVTVTGVELDETAPTAEIQLGENKWNQFLNSITFGLFFKDTQTVTISSADAGSGVEKTEYVVSDTVYADSTALETAVDGGWNTYSDSFNIEPNSKNIIYAKVTDNVGNAAYVSSQGIVLYADAAQKTQSISFTKTGTADVTAEVTLNGNTVSEIYCGDAKLNAGTDYTVNGGTIIFKASWLNALSAGDYTLTVHYNPMGEEYVTAGGNVAPATTSIALNVQKAAGSVEITNDISKVYDGNAVSDVIYQASSTGDVTVEYKVRGAEDSAYAPTKPSAVGDYTVRVTVTADGNYNEASDTADFAITYLQTPAAPFELSSTSGQNGWYTSDVTITPPEGYTVSDTLNGEYSASLTVSASAEAVKIYLKDEDGQMTDAVSVGDIKIDKDDPTITATGDTTKYLQIDTAKIAVSDSTSGVAKVEVKKDDGAFADITTSYESGYKVTQNGTYTFRVTDHAGRTKEAELIYSRIDAQKPVVTIEALLHGGGTYTSGAWTNQDITLTPKNQTSNLGTTTYQYRVDEGEWQDYTSSIVISTDTDADGTVYEFKAKSASGVESDAAASITVKRDTIAPDGDITIKESSIRRFLNAITFGLFFNEDVDVTVTGTDDLSGVASIQYYRSAEILAQDDLTSLTGWTEYDSAIHETAEDTEKFIYYVKVTDMAGNVTLFGSDGVVFDLTAPSITGVTNGSTYYTTQEVTVTDTNLDSVTLGSEPAILENGVLTLSGNTDAAYTITATDKAGNSMTVTVTMKPVASLAEDINGLTTENVTSDDEETITAVKTAAGNVGTESATEEEKAALQEILDNCDALLGKLTDVAQEISDVTTSVGGYDPDSVKSSDKEAIEALIERIDSLLGGENLTEEEKQNLETVKGNAGDLLGKIEETAGELSNVTGGVGGYAPDSVKASDKEAIESLVEQIDALLGGENLTEEEKQDLEAVKGDAGDLLGKIEETAGELSAVTGGVGGYDPDSVKVSDKEAIESLVEQIDALLGGENLTEEEKQALEAVKGNAEDLLEQIGEAAQATDTQAIQLAAGITNETVGLKDKDTLTAARDDLQAALEDYSGNYTETEISAIREEIVRIEEGISIIENVEQVMELIGALPDPENVTVSDEPQIQAAAQAYDMLTGHEKEMIEAGMLQKLEGVQATLEAVKEESDHPQETQPGTGTSNSGTSASNTGAATGATQPVSPGTDSETSGTPQTGERSLPWFTLLLLGVAGLTTAAAAAGKKRKQTR